MHCCEVHGTIVCHRKSHLVKVYSLPSQKQVPAAIGEFFIDVGVPDPSLDFKVHFDGAGENVNSAKLLKRKYIMHFHHSEADRQHQNPAERYIQEVKKRAEKLLSVFGGHECLEYLMCNHIPDAMNIVAEKSFNWKIPLAQLTGQTPDISNFRFHRWVPIWFLDSNKPFFERMHPGYYLSIAHATGDEFCYNVQPCWKPKEEMPKVLQRGVVLPRYPNKTFLGGVERPMSGSSFPTRDEPATLPLHMTGGSTPICYPTTC